MPKNPNIRKVLVIGSGPIVIGQAAEFDYAGTQACRVLKEEGVEVVLVNSNPATIMTDTDIADKVYLEPLTVGSLEKIIDAKHPNTNLCLTGRNFPEELLDKVDIATDMKKLRHHYDNGFIANRGIDY